MATLLAEYRATVLTVFVMIVFFLWMDVSLYYKIQSLKPYHQSSFTKPTETAGESLTDTSTTSTHLFSPFKGLSVKMAMMDQVNNYIFTPLAEIFNEVTHFSKNFYFITPNMISFIGFLFAVFASKLVTFDSLAMHRLAVVVFQIRTFFDALDGIVAREHLGIKKHVSLHYTSGYMVDATADTFGFAFFLFGCYIYLRRNLPKQRYNNHQYLPLQIQDGSPSINKPLTTTFMITQYIPPKLVWTTRQVFFVVMCFALQLALSAFFWNRYIEAYHQLLESTPKSPAEAKLQNEVLRSSIMWVLMWFWRISNAHSLMQMLLLAVFLNRLWEFLTWIQYIGFLEILTLAFFTEIHLNDVESYISRLA
ncbi:hypothetical protein B4U79_15230 [Dinothrombium tinctorium]|uniref:Ceramide phosphoethanolamine synthase n=1 Tax=Dinothrombium tinctorium TaxID=1965070 RepID=A0A443QGG8_9ACAR|nr:hypothetical protein B4U79_15230 [Dinothrombium tinctorium]